MKYYLIRITNMGKCIYYKPIYRKFGNYKYFFLFKWRIDWYKTDKIE